MATRVTGVNPVVSSLTVSDNVVTPRHSAGLRRYQTQAKFLIVETITYFPPEIVAADFGVLRWSLRTVVTTHPNSSLITSPKLSTRSSNAAVCAAAALGPRENISAYKQSTIDQEVIQQWSVPQLTKCRQ